MHPYLSAERFSSAGRRTSESVVRDDDDDDEDEDDDDDDNDNDNEDDDDDDDGDDGASSSFFASANQPTRL